MAYNGKTNWVNNEIVEAVDMNRIEQGITDLDVGKMNNDGTGSQITELEFANGGIVTYNPDTQILDITNPDGSVMNVGKELWVVGKTTEVLLNGDLAQYAGTQGDFIKIKKAVPAEIDANPSLLLGICTTPTLTNQWVKVTRYGEVNNINTSMWLAGDILYFDPVSGGLTKTEPGNGYPCIEMAAVQKVHASVGILMVDLNNKTNKAKHTRYDNSIANVLDATNVQDAIDKDAAKITNSFYADLNSYFGNVKTIDDFQDVSGWTAGAGVIQSTDIINVKIGKQSMKIVEPDNGGSSITTAKNGISLDMTKLNNGEVSGDDDYVYLVAYVSDATKLTTIELAFSADSTYTNANTKKYNFLAGILVNGWNFLKAKKSAFATAGVISWNDIKSIRAAWASTDNAQNAYVSFQLIQLVKKDPIEDYPNPFQKNSVRDFAINIGEWFVGKEFGRVVVKEIQNEGAYYTGLDSEKVFENFIAERIVNADPSDDSGGITFSNANSTTDSVIAEVGNHNLYLYSLVAGVGTTYQVPFPVSIGDIITLRLEKNGSNIKASAIKNGDLSSIKTVVGTTPMTTGKIYLGSRQFYPSYIYSFSVSEISHAHHADIAEVAKGLVRQAHCVLRNSIAQSIPSGNIPFIKITYDTVLADYHENFNSIQPTRITIREPGVYIVRANVSFPGNTSGNRVLEILLNNVRLTRVSQLPTTSALGPSLSVVEIRYFAAGDYLESAVYQESGTSLDISSQSLSITKIG